METSISLKDFIAKKKKKNNQKTAAWTFSFCVFFSILSLLQKSYIFSQEREVEFFFSLWKRISWKLLSKGPEIVQGLLCMWLISVQFSALHRLGQPRKPFIPHSSRSHFLRPQLWNSGLVSGELLLEFPPASWVPLGKLPKQKKNSRINQSEYSHVFIFLNP